MNEHFQVPDGSRQLAPGSSLAILADIPPGGVRTFFVPDVPGALAQLELGGSLGPDVPLLAVAWPRDADFSIAIDHILRALAGVAWARWPDWYGAVAPFKPSDESTADGVVEDARAIEALGALQMELNRAWVGDAIRRCRQGKRPVIESFPPAVQAQQLILALAQPDLVLLLALEGMETPDASLHYFARTAAWAAGEMGVRVAVFAPSAYREAEALDSISFGAVHLSGDNVNIPCGANRQRASDRNTEAVKRAGAPVPQAPGRRPNPSADVPASGIGPRKRMEKPGTGGAPGTSAPRRANDEPLRLVSPPILGRPHPASPGEQLLAKWLGRDAELAPLFEFNQRVDTASGESFVVDLVWRAGKLTVEVDGYSWHSGPHAFAADRYRDYRLLCDGYRTLRLPHDEVIDDPALQCEKIRDVVRAIQKER